MPGSNFYAAVAAVATVVVICSRTVLAELRSSCVISPPFDKHDHRGARIVPFWDKTGSTSIMQSFIRVRNSFPCIWICHIDSLCCLLLISGRSIRHIYATARNEVELLQMACKE